MNTLESVPAMYVGLRSRREEAMQAIAEGMLALLLTDDISVGAENSEECPVSSLAESSNKRLTQLA